MYTHPWLVNAFLAIAAVSLLACNNDSGGGSGGPMPPKVDDEAAAPGEVPEGLAEALEEGDEDEGGTTIQTPGGEIPVEALDVVPRHRVWIGAWCNDQSGRRRRFSFYVNGSEVNRVDGNCRGDVSTEGTPPNAGQFAIELPQGVHVLRVQDDTADFHSEQTLMITAPSWIVVNHRVVPEGGGYMMTFDASTERSHFDLEED